MFMGVKPAREVRVVYGWVYWRELQPPAEQEEVIPARSASEGILDLRRFLMTAPTPSLYCYYYRLGGWYQSSRRVSSLV